MATLLFAILALFSSAAAFRSVCYYTNRAQHRPGDGKYLPENINASLCTHIVYAFANIKNLNLENLEENEEDIPSSKGMYSRVVKWKETYPHLKVLLATGGWIMGSAPFLPLIESKESMETFAKNAVDFLRKRNFDGLDMLWIYEDSMGITAEDKPKFTLLMKTLGEEFKREGDLTGKPRLLLSAAVSADKMFIDSTYEVAEVSGFMDFLNVITYDFHGSWENFVGINSPLYAYPDEVGDARFLNLDWAVKYWVELGAPRDKINVGIGTYARTFTLADTSKTSILSPSTGPGNAQNYTLGANYMSYYEVCEFVRDGAQVVDVPSTGGRYAYKGNQWVGYNDVEDVVNKTCYAKQNGYGGVFLWTLDFDDFNGKFCNKGPYPLLKASYNAVRSPKGCASHMSVADTDKTHAHNSTSANDDSSLNTTNGHTKLQC